MRTTFLTTLLQHAARDPRIWLLCGDLGYSVLEPFIKQFPERYINVGVAEQNMMGIAAGLALTGNKVVCYSIGNFNTMRCFEQIRNDVCYHDADVKIVSVGGGLAYGVQGYTHHAIEDLAVMRALPGITVMAPGDPLEVRLTTSWMLTEKSPCYLRLGKAGEPTLHDEEPPFAAGKILELRKGQELLLLSTGGMLDLAISVADDLLKLGVKAGVASCPFIKPFDEAALKLYAKTYPWIVTLEEHTRFGGLNEIVAATLVQWPTSSAQLLPFYVPEHLLKGIAGSQQDLLKRVGLSRENVTKTIMQKCTRTSR